MCCLNTSLCRCRCLPSIPLTNNKRVKLGYVLFLLLGYAALIVVSSIWYEPSVPEECPLAQPQYPPITYSSSCSWNEHSIIIFTALGVFHLFMAGAMLCRSDKVKLINEGLWLPKVLTITALTLLVRLFYPLIPYALHSVTSACGVLLFLFGGMVFVDLLYAVDLELDALATRNNKLYLVRVGMTVLGLLWAVWLCVYGWGLPSWTYWTNSGLLLLFLVMGLLRIFQGNSILIATLVSVMLSFTAFYLPNPSPPLLTPTLLLIRTLSVLFLLLGMISQGSNKLRTRKSSLT